MGIVERASSVVLYKYKIKHKSTWRVHTSTMAHNNKYAKIWIILSTGHRYKIFSGNIYGLILINKMAAMSVFRLSARSFVTPSRAKGIIGRDLKFAGYMFGLILKNTMAVKGVSLSVMQQCVEIFRYPL